jgi:hypothetical protein
MKKNIPIFFFVSIIVGIFFCSTVIVFAASLSLSPASGSYSAGDSFLVQVVVSSKNEAINAVSSTITFPTDKLQVVSLSKSSSIINFWVTDPTFSNSSGKVHLEGVILNPGFQGSNGNILTLYMKAKSAGEASLTFSSVSVLANDGQGTDVTQGVTGGSFSIKVMKMEESKVESKVEPKTVAPELATTTNISPEILPEPAEIVVGTKYGASAIIGTSLYGKSQVLLTFVASDGTKIFITGATDDNGSFSLLVPKTLKHGMYTVTAVLIKTDGTHSDSSNKISIQIGNIFSDIGWEVWSAIVLLVVTVIYLLLRVFFHVQKIQKVRASNKREVREAEKILHKTFDVLREDLSKHERSPEFKKDIDDVEKVIDGEIKDLES